MNQESIISENIAQRNYSKLKQKYQTTLLFGMKAALQTSSYRENLSQPPLRVPAQKYYLDRASKIIKRE